MARCDLASTPAVSRTTREHLEAVSDTEVADREQPSNPAVRRRRPTGSARWLEPGHRSCYGTQRVVPSRTCNQRALDAEPSLTDSPGKRHLPQYFGLHGRDRLLVVGIISSLNQFFHTAQFKVYQNLGRHNAAEIVTPTGRWCLWPRCSAVTHPTACDSSPPNLEKTWILHWLSPL